MTVIFFFPIFCDVVVTAGPHTPPHAPLSKGGGVEEKVLVSIQNFKNFQKFLIATRAHKNNNKNFSIITSSI